VLIELHQSFLDNPPAYAGVQPAPVCNLLIGNINQVRTCNGQAVVFVNWQEGALYAYILYTTVLMSYFQSALEGCCSGAGLAEIAAEHRPLQTARLYIRLLAPQLPA